MAGTMGTEGMRIGHASTGRRHCAGCVAALQSSGPAVNAITCFRAQCFVCSVWG